MIADTVTMTTILLTKQEAKELKEFLNEGVTHIENTRPSELSHKGVDSSIGRELIKHL